MTPRPLLAAAFGLSLSLAAAQADAQAPTPAAADAASSPQADRATSELAAARADYDRGEWDRALRRYEAAIQASDPSSVTRVEATLERSALLWERGDYSQARQALEAAIEQAKKLQLEEALGRLLLTLGHIETSQGRLSAASKTLALCAELAAERKDAVYASLCRLNLSLVQRLSGGKGLSDEATLREIDAIKTSPSPLAAGLALAKTAELYSRRKDHAQALAMLRQAQAQFARADSTPAQARNRLKIAQALQDLGQWAEARAEVDQALAPLRQMGHRPALVQAYGLLGAHAQQAGDRQEAFAHYTQSLKLAQQLQSPQLIASSHLAVCDLLGSPPIMAQAEQHCAQAASIFGRQGAQELKLRAQVKLANIQQASGQWTQARASYVELIKQLELLKPATPEQTRVLAIQRANLCQVDHALEATGTMHTCRQAIKALRASSLEPAQAQEYLAASAYAAAFGALREQRAKEAIAHLDEAIQGYIARADALRAADAAMHQGTLLARIKGQESNAQRALELGLAQLARVPTGDERAATIRVQLKLQLAQLTLSPEALHAVLDDPARDPDARAWAYHAQASLRLKAQDKPGAIASLEAGIQEAQRGKDRYELLALMRQQLKQLQAP